MRYLPSLPYINAMEKDTGFGAGQLTLILAGTALIFLMNKKNLRRKCISHLWFLPSFTRLVITP